MMKHRYTFVALAALSLSALLPTEAVWLYDATAKTITKNGVSINVGVWNGTRLSIVDNRNRTDIVELDFTDGIEDETGKAYTIQQINALSSHRYEVRSLTQRRRDAENIPRMIS